MGAIGDHPSSKPLMIKCIQALDNIAMANQEHAALVIEVCRLLAADSRDCVLFERWLPR